MPKAKKQEGVPKVKKEKVSTGKKKKKRRAPGKKKARGKAEDEDPRNFKWFVISKSLGYNPKRDQRPKSQRKNRKMEITRRKLMPNAQARFLIIKTAMQFMDKATDDSEDPTFRMGPVAKNMIIEVVANNLYEVARCARNYAESARREMITEDDMCRAIADQGTTYTRRCSAY